MTQQQTLQVQSINQQNAGFFYQLAVGPVESAFIQVGLEQGQSALYVALARRSVKQLN